MKKLKNYIKISNTFIKKILKLQTFGLLIVLLSNNIKLHANIQIILPLGATSLEAKPEEKLFSTDGNLFFYGGQYQYSKNNIVLFDKKHDGEVVELLISDSIEFSNETSSGNANISEMWISGKMISENELKNLNKKDLIILGKLFKLQKNVIGNVCDWTIESHFIINSLDKKKGGVDNTKPDGKTAIVEEKNHNKFVVKKQTIIFWGDPESVIFPGKTTFVQQSENFNLPPIILGQTQTESLLKDLSILKYLQKISVESTISGSKQQVQQSLFVGKGVNVVQKEIGAPTITPEVPVVAGKNLKKPVK